MSFFQIDSTPKFSFRALIYDIEQLAEVDGYSTWREKESNDLSNLVQERFRYLQNPENCNTAKKLLCNLNKVRQKKYKFICL